MLYGVEHLALGYVENSQESGPFNVPAIRRLISVTAGAVIAAVIWWLLRTRSTKVPSVKKGGEWRYYADLADRRACVAADFHRRYGHVDRSRSGAARVGRDVRSTVRALGAS